MAGAFLSRALRDVTSSFGLRGTQANPARLVLFQLQSAHSETVRKRRGFGVIKSERKHLPGPSNIIFYELSAAVACRTSKLTLTNHVEMLVGDPFLFRFPLI